MTQSLQLGRAPGTVSVALVPGAAFTATLKSQTQAGQPVNWPAAASLRLVLARPNQAGTSYPWTILGDTATVTISQAQVDALPTGALRAQLWLNYGQGEFLWCSGQAIRYA